MDEDGETCDTGGSPSGIAAADLDRDGDLDFVVAHRTHDGAGSSCVIIRGR